MKMFSIVFVFTFATICFAQDGSEPLNSCTQSDSPIIQGLRLGTSFALIKRDTKLELSKKTALKGREGTYVILSPNKNVDAMLLEFYKDQLSSIMVSYSKIIKWNSLGEFAAKTSQSMNVFGKWRAGTLSGGRLVFLECSDFDLAFGVDSSTKYFIRASSKDISLQQLKDKAKEESRKSMLNQKRKEIFKP